MPKQAIRLFSLRLHKETFKWFRQKGLKIII